MRLMDAELGEPRSTSANSAVNNGSTIQPRAAPLPLPDAAALDWATLVHTATRAMLQVLFQLLQ